MPTRFLIVVAAVLLVAAVAIASNITRKTASTATAVSYCAGGLGARVGFQCDGPVYAATGRLFPYDGGTPKRTSDAGNLVPNTTDDLYVFPGDPAKIDLGPNENCFALLSADAGANTCNFKERNAP